MEAKSQDKQCLPVMCPRCTAAHQRHEGTCELCGGRKFFYWDSETLLGSRADGALITLDTQSLTDAVDDPFTEDGLTTDDLLSFFALWAAEVKTRKFKLWFENGWRCYAWENRYSTAPISARAADVHQCVRECYEKLLQARGIK